jgi:hypothetical protein
LWGSNASDHLEIETEAMNLQSLKIISGGQTGPDRAALDVAIKNGIPRGGWWGRNDQSIALN